MFLLSLWLFNHIRVVLYHVEFLKFNLGKVAGSAELSRLQPVTMAFPREARSFLDRGGHLYETVMTGQSNLTQLC